MSQRVSRLAPSPTGALHLGNARTFLINWALARQEGWQLLLRIEDLDGPRNKPGAEASALADLAWLGIDHDGVPLRQSDDLDPYRHAMQSLAAQELVFACDLSRSAIEAAASAPHDDGHELRYAPSLRPPAGDDWAFADELRNYRLRVEPGAISIDDVVADRVVHDPAEETGDFVVWTRRGQPSYQLAVVVDDARQGVTDVIRGDDLLGSAARQVLLYRALELDAPRWWHVPLVRGADGRRLAKRHGDTRIAQYRERGATAERVIGLLGHWCGILDHRAELDAASFRDRFDLDRLSRSPVTFTSEDDAWLAG